MIKKMSPKPKTPHKGCVKTWSNKRVVDGVTLRVKGEFLDLGHALRPPLEVASSTDCPSIVGLRARLFGLLPRAMKERFAFMRSKWHNNPGVLVGK